MSTPFPVPSVSVRGEAHLVVDPEIADLAVTVRVRARDRQTALERCRARQEHVTAVVGQAGDAVESAETTAIGVHLEHFHGGSGDPVATQHTRLRVGALDAVGALVVALGRLDDVELSGPSWGLRPDSPAYDRGRLAAVSDAVRRARSYAAAFGAELTALLEVSDPGTAGSGLRVTGSVAALSFEAGDLTLDVTPMRCDVHGAVEVRFAMSEPEQEVFRG
jgi:uncharacterized protein YggE